GMSGKALLMVVLADMALDQRQGGDALLDEGVDLALRALGTHAPHPHRSPEDLDGQQQDGHRDQGHHRQARVQPGHGHGHEEEGAGGADDDEDTLLEQNLKGAGVGACSEDDVPGFGAVVKAERQALEPGEDVVANAPQAAEPDADREVDMAGTHGRVDEMKGQRCRNDRHELCRWPPGGYPGGGGLGREESIDQDRERQWLEEVEPDAEEQQAKGEDNPPSVRTEVRQRPKAPAETRAGGREATRAAGSVHIANRASRKW